MNLLTKLAIFLVLFFSPWILTVEAKMAEFPIGSGKLVEIDKQGNILSPKYIWKEFILPTGLKIWGVVLVEHAKADEPTLKEQIELYARSVADKYDISYKRLSKIIVCESNWNPQAYNPKDTDGFPKFGLLQFHKPTFYGAGGKDIWSYEEQLEIGAEMMGDGYWRRWPTCSK